MTAPTTPRRLYRSTRDAKLGGVCGGVAEHLGWDPTAVRLAVALSILLPGPQVIAYVIAWIVLPRDVDVWAQPGAYGPPPHTAAPPPHPDGRSRGWDTPVPPPPSRPGSPVAEAYADLSAADGAPERRTLHD